MSRSLAIAAGDAPVLAGGSLWRARVVFGSLGAVPVFLVGWLFVLQVLQRGELEREGRQPLRLTTALAADQGVKVERLPAPRGTILDRHGAVLAIDGRSFEVRAAITLPSSARTARRPLVDYLEGLATDLAAELARDPELKDRVGHRRQQRERLRQRLFAEFEIERLPAERPFRKDECRIRGDILVGSGIVSAAVTAGLRALDEARDSVLLHWLHTHDRVYPDRDATWGLIGFEQAIRPEAAVGASFVRTGITGIETASMLAPRLPGAREYALNAAKQGFWRGPAEPPGGATQLESTIDLELQKTAMLLLDQQARGVVGTDGKARLPLWGSLVLVEVATGDVLAAASWHRDDQSPKGKAFTPSQYLYEPGSIVKPLVFSYALQHAGLDWHQVYGCAPTLPHYGTVVAETGRLVYDDHACGDLTPAGILINSSNIGAVKVGSLLTRDQWRRYMDFYGFDRLLAVGLPNEARGRPNARSFDPKVPERQFRRWSGSSFSIGYEHYVTALQVARAYLSMVHGAPSDLRLLRAASVDGVRHEAPPAARGSREFSPAVFELIAQALADNVGNDPQHPRATGRNVHALILKEEGVDLHGLMAGKTGTAKVTRKTAKGEQGMRNASFVGFLPTTQPRYLAVCVLQRDDGARFYGGSYAAPPVARLLLHAQRLEDRRRLRLEPQVSVAPGEQAGPREGAGDIPNGRK